MDYSVTVVLKVWPLERPGQHYLGTCWKRKFPGPASDILLQKFWGWAKQ